MTTHGPHWSNRAGNPSLEEPHWWAYIKTPPFITAPMLLSPQSPVPLSLWDKGFYLSHTKSIKKNTIQSLFLSRQDSQSLSIFSHPRSPAFMVSSCSVGQSQCVPCRVCVCLPAKNTICSSLCGVKFIGMSTSMKPTQKREKWRNWHRNCFFSCLLIGVCQLANKMDEASGSVKAFNRNDEQFLEAFAIFCGLGIQNTQMYETVERAMAKQEVTLEVRDFLLFFCTLMHRHKQNPAPETHLI